MKRYISFFTAIALIAGMMTSCNDDGYWDKASTANLGLTEGAAFTFNTTTLNYVYYPADVTEGMDIPITITRSDAAAQFTLPVAATFSDSTILSGPKSVTFEAGSNQTDYVIKVNKEVAIGQSVSASLAIDTLSLGIPKVNKPIAPIDTLSETSTPADSAAYQAKYTVYQADSTNYEIYLTKLKAYNIATTVKISKDYNWNSLGKGLIVENWWFENGDAPASVEIMQAVENPAIFRVVNPWKPIADAVGAGLNGNQTNIQFTLLKVGDEFRGQTVSQKDLVFFDRSNTGYHHSSYDADIWILHPSEFSSLGTEDKWLYSRVTAYQANGLPATIQLAPYYYMFGVGGWNHTQEDGIVQITFPGVKVYDYSADIAYAGLFTDVDNTVYALADYELTGADAQAATVKVAVISEDDDMEAVADAIAAGDFEAPTLQEVLNGDRIQVAIPEDMSGKLQIVMVVVDNNEEGQPEVKNVVSTKFEYYSGANPWQSIGQGYFVDDFVLPLFGNDPLTCPVEIQENSNEPGLYRMVKAYSYIGTATGKGGGNADIEVNATNSNAVYILTQSTGLDLGYGVMSIATVGGDNIEYFAEKGYAAADVIAAYPDEFGKVTDGVISFPVLEREASDGSTMQYMGYVYDADGGYYAGKNGAFQIVLPSAAASVKAKAKSMARASEFALRLSGKSGVKAIKMHKKIAKPVKATLR
jgi:hypothetical protein